jgi:hypothetical protein
MQHERRNMTHQQAIGIRGRHLRLRERLRELWKQQGKEHEEKTQ